MTDEVRHLIQAGGGGDLVELFNAVAESGRYGEGPVLERLARIIAGTGGGPNRDAPLYELCHLLNAIDACGFQGDGERMLFFMGAERVTPGILEAQVRNRLAEAGGLLRGGFDADGKGVRIDYGESRFQVRYGRMPVLAALYEFLAGIDGYTFFAELNDIFDEMLTGAVDAASVRTAANRIASRFRKYRHAHMDWARHEEKFDPIARYLSENASDGRWRIDDAAVLAFWLLHSQGTEFRGYKTVFEAFVTLMKTLERSGVQSAEETALRLGSDREAGEVDPAQGETEGLGIGEWNSPLAVFDREELKDIKFFKGVSERKPLEPLMRYGPYAARLPLAFLRLESFQPIQAGITNDLQVKRGRESVERRITCADAVPYPDKAEQLGALLDHVKRLQLTVLHVLRDAVDEEDMAMVVGAAGEAYAGMKRKGFEADASNADRMEAFRPAAESLVAISGQLEAILGKWRRLDGTATGLAALFAEDRQTFSTQFQRIYGEAR
ncbi:MAG: hypothetical protein QGF68_18745 [Nitrospinota bacterium]|nr:hypothetical protein [Nitrospinota bacterium]